MFHVFQLLQSIDSLYYLANIMTGEVEYVPQVISGQVVTTITFCLQIYIFLSDLNITMYVKTNEQERISEEDCMCIGLNFQKKMKISFS